MFHTTKDDHTKHTTFLIATQAPRDINVPVSADMRVQAHNHEKKLQQNTDPAEQLIS